MDPISAGRFLTVAGNGTKFFSNPGCKSSVYHLSYCIPTPLRRHHINKTQTKNFVFSCTAPCIRTCHVVHTGVLLGLFFNPEDKGKMFLRNVDRFLTDYMALHLRDGNLHSHYCENLRSCKTYISFEDVL
jgi:hypothetical protein